MIKWFRVEQDDEYLKTPYIISFCSNAMAKQLTIEIHFCDNLCVQYFYFIVLLRSSIQDKVFTLVIYSPWNK